MTKKCICCGKEFEVDNCHQYAKYCSNACRAKYVRKHNKHTNETNYLYRYEGTNKVPICTINERLEEKYPGKFIYISGYTGSESHILIKCQKCGYEFKHGAEMLRPSRTKKVECPNCIKMGREREKLELQKQKDIIDNQRKAVANKLKKKKAISKFIKTLKQMKECQICGNKFYSHGSKEICPKCSNKRKWGIKEAYQDKFPIIELYNKYKGVCYLCGGKCDLNDYVCKGGRFIAYGNYPSRDHVIPKSKGGSILDESNIRLAHIRCNSKKGAKIIA